MAITWYETNMTSNTEPSPLVVSASSFHVDSSNDALTFYPYKAFSGDDTEGSGQAKSWASSNGQQEYAWLKIDFGELKRINTVELTSRFVSAQTPREWFIEGSTDDNNWVNLGYFRKPSWTALEKEIYNLSLGDYRYLKITSVFSGATHSSWLGVKYGYNDEALTERPLKGVISYGASYYSVDKNALISLPSLKDKYINKFGIGTEGALMTDLSHKKTIYETGKTLDGVTVYSHKLNRETGFLNFQVERIDI